MKQAPKQIVKLADLIKVLRFCDRGNYIFRGENKDYGQDTNGKVTSGLYREYSKGKSPLTDHHGFSVLDVEENIVKDARKHLQDGASDIEVLTELQHYGGKTNLIDFTKNLLIALFFACEGEIDEGGRLILTDVDKLNNIEINYNESKKAIQTDNILTFPTGKSPRAIFQSSAFVHPHKGYLEKGDYQSIIVKAELKSTLLEYLHKHHDISAETVYNDIHGFIRNQSGYTTADVEFYRGFSFAALNDLESAVLHYSNAIKLNPQMFIAYLNRGLKYVQLKRYDEAIADYTKVIEFNPHISFFHSMRGDVHKSVGKLDAAMADYNKAVEVGHPDANCYIGRGELYKKLNETDNAINDFQRAIRIDPANQIAHEHLGLIYLYLENAKKALEHLRIARDLNIQKKHLEKAEKLTSAIAALEIVLGEETRPNAKVAKPKK